MRGGGSFRAIFADTGNEHEHTYEFVNTLSSRTGGPPVEVVRADLTARFPARRERIRKDWAEQGIAPAIIDQAVAAMRPTGNPFLDLCLLRNGFPTVQQRFCTDHLKIQPMEANVHEPLRASGKLGVAWLGIRRDESPSRRHLPKLTVSKDRIVYRPIIDWATEDVWAIHRRHGLPRNRLYDEGASRVGCAPCIYARKAEVRMWARKFPDVVDRIRTWERLVSAASKRRPAAATFFQGKRIGRDKPYLTETHGIDAQVSWAEQLTAREVRRQQPELPFPEESDLLATACAQIGYCE